MMGSKRRASRDMARMDGKHFSLDSVLTVLSFLILVVVVVIPMVMIVYNTFFYEGKFDTSLFTQIILDPGNVAAMWNTIKIALLVTLFGTIVGLFFAWLLGRSDIPFKGLMRSMFAVPYMFPPFFGAMAWELLLSPRSGYLNKWLMATFGLSAAPLRTSTPSAASSSWNVRMTPRSCSCRWSPRWSAWTRRWRNPPESPAQSNGTSSDASPCRWFCRPQARARC